MVNCFMARSQTNLQFEGNENVYYPTKVELTSVLIVGNSIRLVSEVESGDALG
jgi:hypothetical protein